jgi:3-methyladenine DNA glycosylase AlkD
LTYSPKLQRTKSNGSTRRKSLNKEPIKAGDLLACRILNAKKDVVQYEAMHKKLSTVNNWALCDVKSNHESLNTSKVYAVVKIFGTGTKIEVLEIGSKSALNSR